MNQYVLRFTDGSFNSATGTGFPTRTFEEAKLYKEVEDAQMDAMYMIDVLQIEDTRGRVYYRYPRFV